MSYYGSQIITMEATLTLRKRSKMSFILYKISSSWRQWFLRQQEGSTREKGPFNVYIFQQPIALSKTGRFQNNSDRWKKGTKNYITVSLVLKITSCFRYWPLHDISQYFVIEFVPSAVLS